MMNLEKDVILKEFLSQRLQNKISLVKCFERLLSDYDGKLIDPKIFVLVDNDIYFVDDRKRNIAFVCNLFNILKLETVPTPSNVGLSDAHRIECTIEIIYNVRKTEIDCNSDNSMSHLQDDETSKYVSFKESESNKTIVVANGTDSTASKKTGCCFKKQPASNLDTSNSSITDAVKYEKIDGNQDSVSKTGCFKSKSKSLNENNVEKINGTPLKNGELFSKLHKNSATDTFNNDMVIPSDTVKQSIPLVMVKNISENGYGKFLLCCGYFARSSLYLHLRNAWNLTVIKRTLMKDREFAVASTPRYSKSDTEEEGFLSPFAIPEHHLATLFSTLRLDILSSKGNFKQLFKTTYELKLALDRQYPIKKYFWENADLFHYLIRMLGDYLPRQPDLNTPVMFRVQELDICILIFQVISLVFQETDYLESRAKVLKMEQGMRMEKLIRLCAMRIHTNITDFSYSPSNSQIEHRLIEEIITEKASFLYHIITFLRSTMVANVQFLANSRMLSEVRVVQMLSLEPGILDFMFDLVKYISYQISVTVSRNSDVVATNNNNESIDKEDDEESPSHDRAYLKPIQVIKLYYCCFVLASLIEGNEQLRKQLADKYSEEFKFFIHPERVEQCLSSDIPIRDNFMKLVTRTRDLLIL